MEAGIPTVRRRVFVVMPFGQKEVPKRPRADALPEVQEKEEPLKVDFDDVYKLLFKPALNAAGLQPFRADDEKAAGNILKDMFAELVTADIVLADISILNANVFYELGVRHGVGPRGVICVHAGWADRPFDVAPERTFKYDGQLFRAGRERDAAWTEALEAEILRLARTIRDAVIADRTTEGSPVYSNLPNLKPVDASRIETSRFKHYRALAQDWEQRVDIAARDGRPEDILTLAGDVPSPYYRRKLLHQCGDALLALCRFSQAEKIYRELEGLEQSGSIDEFRVKCRLALVANRLGRAQEAKVNLANLVKATAGDREAQGLLGGLLGRVYKDMWRAKWGGRDKPVAERLRVAASHATLAKSALETYGAALRQDIGVYYNGINVLTLAALLEHVARANNRPADFNDVVAAVRLASSGRIKKEGEAVWARATLGELHLVLGQGPEAYHEYEEATADPDLTWFNIRSMLEQVQLFELLDYQPAAVQPVAKLLEERCAERARPHIDFKKVAICSGHMIDKPDRPTARFPREKEPVVRAEIAKRLESWNIGPGDLAVCGGARGADILFAEECLRRGAHVRLLLAQESETFINRSVRLEGSDWVERFYAVGASAEIATQPERLGEPPEGVSIFERNNVWIINTARIEASRSADCYALLVWDEQVNGLGHGGAAHFVQQMPGWGGDLAIVNPSKLCS